MRLATIRRPDSSAFGEIALPEGVIRVFAPDTAGRAQLLGEASIGEQRWVAHFDGERE